MYHSVYSSTPALVLRSNAERSCVHIVPAVWTWINSLKSSIQRTIRSCHSARLELLQTSNGSPGVEAGELGRGADDFNPATPECPEGGDKLLKATEEALLPSFIDEGYTTLPMS